MRFFGTAGAIMFAVSIVSAQDGIYGSFIVGQKFVNLKPLNDTLKNNGIQIEFPSHNWTIGGEGHMIVAEHFVLGGKGFAFFSEKKNPADPAQRMKISGGLGIGSIGYTLFSGRSTGLRLFPQVGLGVAPFMFQTKRNLDSTNNTFSSVLKSGDDKMAVIEKVGLALDGCICLDWYMRFVHLLRIIPGLETGPLLHAEIGYTLIPGNLRWMRDVDQLASFNPDMKFNGLYINVGIGIGISSSL